MGLARSSFYYKTRLPKSKKNAEDTILKEQIEQILCELPGYGYRRVTRELHRKGRIVNHKRILRIMRENNLLCAIRPKKVFTTNSNHNYRRYPNLARRFTPSGLNQLWVSDITYIRIPSGFVYLSIILDAYSRKVIGFGLSTQLKPPLVLRALSMAIDYRQPSIGCIHHSDQGIQYACLEYVSTLRERQFKISMARIGNPYDNAIVERFMRTLKYEEVHLQEYQTVHDVAKNVPFFIKEVYNKKRLHSALGYLTPDEFEAKLITNLQPIPV